MKLTIEEARLLAIHRAIERFEVDGVVAVEDVGIIASYLPAVLDLNTIEGAADLDMDSILDGFIAGFAANRLINAGLKPEIADGFLEDADSVPTQGQTGVDPVTHKVRNPH